MRRYFLMLLAGGLVLWGGRLSAQGASGSLCPGGMMPGPECAAIHAAEMAQLDAPDAPNAPEAPGPPGPRRRHLEQFRVLKLLELLDLNDKQEMEFLVEFRALRDKLLTLQQERERAVQALASGLRQDTLSDGQITDLVRQVRLLRQMHQEASEAFLERVSKLLTPEQVGKMVVFEERFEYELLDQVRSFRERRGMPGAGHGMPRDSE